MTDCSCNNFVGGFTCQAEAYITRATGVCLSVTQTGTASTFAVDVSAANGATMAIRGQGGANGVIGTAQASGGVCVSGSTAATNGTGGDFECTGSGSCGVFAKGVNYGLYSLGPGYFSGYLTKGGGGWREDHPLKPKTHFLNHGFVESDVMRNAYSGNVELDATGVGKVEMPDWFPHVNGEPSVQLTAKGRAAASPTWDRTSPTTFEVYGTPNGTVSWTVTCPRSSEWVRRNCPGTEIAKVGEEVGRYLHPEHLGLGPDAHVHELVRGAEARVKAATAKGERS